MVVGDFEENKSLPVGGEILLRLLPAKSDITILVWNCGVGGDAWKTPPDHSTRTDIIRWSAERESNEALLRQCRFA